MSVNDLRTPAARRATSFQRALGATCSKARRDELGHAPAKLDLLRDLSLNGCPASASAFARNSPSSTVLPTPRSPVMIIDCSV